MFAWLQIRDGRITLTEIPDFVSPEEMTDKHGTGNLIPILPF